MSNNRWNGCMHSIFIAMRSFHSSVYYVSFFLLFISLLVSVARMCFSLRLCSTHTMACYPNTNRRCSILPTTPSPRSNSLCLIAQQHLVCCGVQLVLVHYTFGISKFAILVQYGDLFISHCGHCHGICPQHYWISLLHGMECFSTFGSSLLLLKH